PAGNDFHLAMRLLLKMQPSERTRAARKGGAVLHETGFKPEVRKFPDAEGAGEPAPLILRRYGIDNPGTLKLHLFKSHWRFRPHERKPSLPRAADDAKPFLMGRKAFRRA